MSLHRNGLWKSLGAPVDVDRLTRSLSGNWMDRYPQTRPALTDQSLERNRLLMGMHRKFFSPLGRMKNGRSSTGALRPFIEGTPET
jgi:hypothetical protein